MASSAGPVQDKTRLSALHRLNLMGTPPEDRFHRITRTATRLFDVPIALVSVIDENRQWFKSCVGLDVPEIPRSISFCAYTVQRDDILVIPDALQDSRFAGNPLVTGHPRVRFYAGYPVSAPDGSKLGTVCILDHKPREFTDDDSDALRDLAAWAQLELGVIQELREDLSQERYLMRTLMDNIPDTIYFKDRDGCFTRVNRAMAALFGLSSPEQAIGKTDSDFFSEEHAEKTRRDEQQIISTGKPLIGIEEREVWPDGRERWVLTTKMPLSDKEGEIAGTFGISRDITETKQAEVTLREREQRFQAFMNNSPFAAFMKDEQGRYIYLNNPMQRFFSRTDLLGKTDFDWVPEATARQLHENDMLVLASGRTLEMLEPMPSPDGSIHEWLAYKFVMRSENGERCLGGVALDITERRRMEEALRQREQTLGGIISASPDIITIVDMEGRITSTSPATTDILGFTPEEQQGKSILQFTHKGDRERLSNLLKATTTGQLQEAHLRYRYRHANGGWVLLESNTRLLTDSQGKYSGAVVISRDVTEQAQFEEELRQAKDEADRANRAKSEFLSRMSHELRTPLNAILGFTQLLEMDATTDDQQESLSHILKAGQHLLNLINEILDISRIEEGRLQMSIEPVLVEEVVLEVIDLVKRQAQQRKISLGVHAPAIAKHYVLADRQRLMQVLLNLLSNAVKYNREAGEITISCGEAVEGMVRINVSDTGLGLNPSQVERLFTPFERLGAEHGTVEGTGLGLALSKRLVEAMQGSIQVTSTVGEGSTFSVILRAAEARVPRPETVTTVLSPLAEPHVEERCILYIEDNLSNLRLIERILERQPNVRLLSAMQGGLGLELAREQLPDLVILDMHLPDMQGDKVLQHLQAAAETASIPVVILSADATPGQVERLLAAGATAYLTKPLDVKQFMQVLESTLHTGQTAKGA